jgi:hypothetical protein
LWNQMLLGHKVVKVDLDLLPTANTIPGVYSHGSYSRGSSQRLPPL